MLDVVPLVTLAVVLHKPPVLTVVETVWPTSGAIKPRFKFTV